MPKMSSGHGRSWLLLLVFCFAASGFVSSSVPGYGLGTSFRLQQHRFNGSAMRNRKNTITAEQVAAMRWRDSGRHRRLLSKSPNSRVVVETPAAFQLGGIADPNQAGLYFTEIELGTPPSKYYVQVDTGSDLLWVNCASCKTCPTSTQLGVQLALYDPGSSLTSKSIYCEDAFCNAGFAGDCHAKELCGYQLGYGDGSTSEGYFVRDALQLNIVAGNKSKSTNATIVFGCGTSQGGQLQSSDQALDGIMGFGQSNLSVVSQLAVKNETLPIFSHCLEGEGDGGGVLVIGEVVAPGLVYTPIVPNQSHYNVNLKSIKVNGVTISVDSSITPVSDGTIIDSGTTLAYFVDEPYQQLIQAVLDAVKLEEKTFQWNEMTCLTYMGSVDDVFPTVTLTFEGSAAEMIIKPQQYLLQSDKGWCIGFQTPSSNDRNLNILGDLILKDRLIVYDLQKERIGWVDYDCSKNVTVISSTNHTETISVSPVPMANFSNSASCLFCGILHPFFWFFCYLLYYNS